MWWWFAGVSYSRLGVCVCVCVAVCWCFAVVVWLSATVLSDVTVVVRTCVVDLLPVFCRLIVVLIACCVADVRCGSLPCCYGSVF